MNDDFAFALVYLVAVIGAIIWLIGQIINNKKTRII